MRIAFVYDITLYTPLPYPQGLLQELSSEHFSSGEANTIVTALKSLGHTVRVIDGTSEFVAALSAHKLDAEFVFNEAKGAYGHDRKMALPLFCKIHQVPYLGSDAYALTLARNKWHTLAVAALMGCPVPKSFISFSGSPPRESTDFQPPLIVKPNNESASIGISDRSLILDRSHLEEEIRRVHDRYCQPVLVQEFIPGEELQISLIGNGDLLVWAATQVRVLGDKATGLSFIRHGDWLQDRVRFEAASDLPAAQAAAGWAMALFQHLGLRDYARLDFRLAADGSLFFIEAAAHPHIVPDASFVVAFGYRGLSFTDVIREILEASCARQGIATHSEQ